MDQQTYETNISFLPPEMILKIFGFLTYLDRLSASLTCIAWHQIAFNPGKMRIRISDRNCLELIQNIQAYEKYRNASVHLPTRTQCNTNVSCDMIRNAIAHIVKTAPIESLAINGNRRSLKTFLNDNLLSMNLLTNLVIVDCFGTNKRVIPISHPNLKSISLGDQTNPGLSFEINCPNLIELTVGRNIEITFTQLQHQLQSLEHICDGNENIKFDANAELSSLRKFCLKFETPRASKVTYMYFRKMRNLVELEIYNNSLNYVLVKQQFGVLTNLSKLTISRTSINAEEFATSLRIMPKLRDLHVLQCAFKLSTEWDRIELDNVKNLYVDSYSLMLPYFTKLKRLFFTNFFNAEIDGTFMHICISYPELEELCFKARNPAKLKFRSSMSFSLIRNLKQLKDLQFIGLDLDGIDWAECNGFRGLKIQLNRCRFRGITALQLGASIGRGLVQLSMNYCYLSPPRVDVFEVYKNGGLRRYLPWCRIVYENCTVMFEDHGFSPPLQYPGEFMGEFMRYLKKK